MAQSFKIKIAILSDNQPSFRKPMALSISRMLREIGVDNSVFYNGLVALRNPTVIEVVVSALLQTARAPIQKILNTISRTRYVIKSLRAGSGRKPSSDLSAPRRKRSIIARFSAVAFRSGRRVESIVAAACDAVKPRPALTSIVKRTEFF